jgi:hypothetical protein
MEKVVKKFAMILVLVCAAACQPPVEPEENLALIYINNQTAVAISNVYVTSCALSVWGDDRLGPSEIFTTNTIRAFGVTPGCWNVRVEAEGGRSAERRDIQLARGSTVDWSLTTW